MERERNFERGEIVMHRERSVLLRVSRVFISFKDLERLTILQLTSVIHSYLTMYYIPKPLLIYSVTL